EINDSPIEEVRLTVPITDDATLPVLTFRTWVLGPTTCILLAVLTARFECRQITIIPSASCFTMLFLPIGKLMAATLPTKPIRTLWTRWSVSMNPGSFNLKEHVLISILATAGLDNPFSLPIVVIAKAFYHKNISFWVCFLLVQSTNDDMFDVNGQSYDVSRVLNDDLTLNQQAYDNYSPIHLSVFFVNSLGFQLAAETATLTHFVLFHWSETWDQIKQIIKGQSLFSSDVHNRMMKKYKPIPQWWFYTIIILMIVLALLNSTLFGRQFQLPYWGVMLGCALPFILILPLGIIRATTGKIVGAFISYSTNLGTTWWLLSKVENMCDKKNLPSESPWTCPGEHMMFSKSIMWGGVGISLLFAPQGVYSTVFILYFFTGMIAPVFVWGMLRLFPTKKWITLIHMPIIFAAGTAMPPIAAVHCWSWFTVAIIFHLVLDRKYKGWWPKYTYLLSNGLAMGIALMELLVSLTLQMKEIYGLNWWGLQRDDHCPLASCPTAPGIKVDGCPAVD
ncbi:hypothetical protein C5167_039042, partial [Papaver somniferum]